MRRTSSLTSSDDDDNDDDDDVIGASAAAAAAAASYTSIEYNAIHVIISLVSAVKDRVGRPGCSQENTETAAASHEVNTFATASPRLMLFLESFVYSFHKEKRNSDNLDAIQFVKCFGFLLTEADFFPCSGCKPACHCRG